MKNYPSDPYEDAYDQEASAQEEFMMYQQREQNG
jgi:hypothetical protein